MSDARSCPVCFEAFAASAGAAFALHVATCTSSSPSPPDSPSSASAAHCPRCLHVYAAGTLAHEISFHEHECARVNALPEEESAAEASDASTTRKPKRQRHAATPAAVAAPRVTLFPTFCFLCGNGGRGLLRCGGSCARSAHQHCVDQLQAPSVGQLLVGAEKKAAADAWQCAQCLRGLHRCQRCGFLGHAADGMKKCAVLDCGFHFHDHCIPDGEQDTVHAGFVCARHTCATCGLQEPDMRRCKSCSVCYHMTHLRCPRGSGAAGQAAGGTTASGGLDPENLFVCPRHDEETAASPTSSQDASNSLRLRLAAGDVVLILEFNNALLPMSAKAAAPDAANHWGVVTSAEETEPHGRGNQLLSVRMFADDNVLVVPNQYAVRVAVAADFSRPADLIRHCLQRHAMVELQLRQMERSNIDDAEAKRVLSVSSAAFAARLEALGVSAAQAKTDAEEGLARWRRFQALPEPRQYDGLGDSAPIYLYVDTRGSRRAGQASGKANAAEAAGADVDGDVPMTDADTDGGGATAAKGSAGASSSATTPPSRPQNAGKSPHEARAEMPDEATGDKPVEEEIVMDLDSHVTKSPSTSRSNSPVEQSQTSTQDTDMASTQDTHPAWSQASSTAPSAKIDVTTSATAKNASPMRVAIADTNSKRASAVIDGASDSSTKRQKIDTDAPARWSSAVFTPTSVRGLVPGATLSSAPASLHISPMSGSARTVLPQKRKHLTRKEKLLAHMPPLVLEELRREAMRYLEEANGPKEEPQPLPADADAFPWAARATSFRPAFYRPTVLMGHSGLRRPGVDAISRLLVSQDKRSIKCFVQTLEADADVSVKCSHLAPQPSSASPGCVLLDLLSLRSFRGLESVVRTRLVEALSKRTRYTREHFGMDAHQVHRWLEQQRRKKASEQPPISLSYCAADGVRRHLELVEASPKPSPKDMQAWLCFCANVCHLSVVITIPTGSHATSTPIVAQPQQVSATGGAK